MRFAPLLAIVATLASSALAQSVLELRSPDGFVLAATYYPAAKPGPGALLFRQSNRPRSDWDDIARKLAAAGIHTLTVDARPQDDAWTKEKWLGDLDAAFAFLVSHPDVKRDVVGLGGAGVLGVTDAVETARLHPSQVKSLALLSGETSIAGAQFLRGASHLPGLFVADDSDEYPPIADAMALLYLTSSSLEKRFVHYPAAPKAPWLWYEPLDVGRVAATGGHGTDLLKTHPELTAVIVDWFTTTLIRTPGHAPIDAVAAAAILDEMRAPGGAARVKQRLLEARRADPGAQLFPEVTASIVGQNHLRAHDPKAAIDVLGLIAFAYADSSDAHENLSEAYLADKQDDLAAQHAQRALALLDTAGIPASSWTDTQQYRGEIRRGAQRVLDKVRPAKNVFRDCDDCPEMVVIPAGTFTMGSTSAEKAWAASHGGSLDSVADEAPQHAVTLRSFALGRYDVKRGEYAAFVRETGHPPGDGCGRDSMKWNKQPGLDWRNPGFTQTDDDPVVCVSWHDAQAYVAWLNGKTHGGYRLPGEAEWEYAARGATTTYFWWGDDDRLAAAHAWFKDNSGGITHPAGSKPANAFGLYDMAGNVWQWTQDCYADTYDSAPKGADACMRVDRGSCWLYPAWLMRPAVRERNPADYRDAVMGFRVAKTL